MAEDQHPGLFVDPHGVDEAELSDALVDRPDVMVLGIVGIRDEVPDVHVLDPDGVGRGVGHGASWMAVMRRMSAPRKCQVGWVGGIDDRLTMRVRPFSLTSTS